MDIAFLLTSLVVVASPGTGLLYTLAAGAFVALGPKLALAEPTEPTPA